jgi:hypothetical protein
MARKVREPRDPAQRERSNAKRRFRHHLAHNCVHQAKLGGHTYWVNPKTWRTLLMHAAQIPNAECFDTHVIFPSGGTITRGPQPTLQPIDNDVLPL